jgi:hypothetical protein
MLISKLEAVIEEGGKGVGEVFLEVVSLSFLILGRISH